MKLDPASVPRAAQILQLADHCVACGLCLPQCPTYRKTESEADSPRGRIALAQGALKSHIPVNERLLLHIDRCLTCRACELACPNHVQFGEIIDGIRSAVAPLRKPTYLENFFLNLLNANSLKRLAWILYLYQRTGLSLLVRKFHLLQKIKLAKLAAGIPNISKPVNWNSLSTEKNLQKSVNLFIGCIARITDISTLRSTIFVLDKLGYFVNLPTSQQCCGALHRHAGKNIEAQEYAKANIDCFSNGNSLITTATGCGAELIEYARYGEQGARLAERTTDVCPFLENADGWNNVKIQTLNATAVVHEPCTGRNVLRSQDAVYALLKRIPGLKVQALPGNNQCCGAAGLYFMTQPEIANSLLSDKVEIIKQHRADYLVTSNVGCAMSLRTALREAGISIPILHPVELLAQQIR